MHYARITLVIGLVMILSIGTNAQKDPIKWKKVNDEEINLKKTSLDTNANAVVLCDYGSLEIPDYEPMKMTRHVRIKILKKEGFDEANISIPYYADFYYDNIDVDAQTLNINKRGRVDREKVRNSDIFKGELNEYYNEVRFTFPKVEVGSILEYKYTLITNNYAIPQEWLFGNELPTLYSEFRVYVGNQVDMRVLLQGQRLMTKYQLIGKTNRWYLTDLKPIKEMPYCPNPRDYANKLKIQIAGYYAQSESYSYNGNIEFKKVLTTWDKLAKHIWDKYGYKDLYARDRRVSDKVDQIVKGASNERDKIKRLFNYVRDNYVWDDYFSIATDKSIRDFLNGTELSKGEFNLFLTHLLQNAGFEAGPVIISTKSHGSVSKKWPMLRQFDHVLAGVKLGNETLLMDASEKGQPYNLLPLEDINKRGYWIAKEGSHWVSIEPNKDSQIYALTNLDYTKMEKLNGHTACTFKSYDAVEYRKKLRASDSDREFIKQYILPDLIEVKLDSFSIINRNSPEKPLSVKANFHSRNSLAGKEIMVLEPFNESYFKNPFVAEERDLPVDLRYTRRQSYIFNVKIPDNHQLENPPKPSRVKLPGKKAQLFHVMSQLGNDIQLRLDMNINDPFFSTHEYPALKTFFEEYIAATRKPLLIKKKQPSSGG